MKNRDLLLHMCCGPCAIMPVMRLRDEGYKVTGWFMNPNIQPLAEYLRRREAAQQCAIIMHMDIIFEDSAWNLAKWLRAVSQRDAPPERCAYCCESRIEALCQAALDYDFTYVSTSLLYSRYQPHDLIASSGRENAKKMGITFVYHDFRQFWQEGIDASTEMGLYRQPYCGCVYSEYERYRKKLDRLIKGNLRNPVSDHV